MLPVACLGVAFPPHDSTTFSFQLASVPNATFQLSLVIEAERMTQPPRDTTGLSKFLARTPSAIFQANPVGEAPYGLGNRVACLGVKALVHFCRLNSCYHVYLLDCLSSALLTALLFHGLSCSLSDERLCIVFLVPETMLIARTISGQALSATLLLSLGKDRFPIFGLSWLAGRWCLRRSTPWRGWSAAWQGRAWPTPS